MTFDEWVSSQPLQVRRDLYEYNWVRHLCENAYACGEKAMAEKQEQLRRDIRNYCNFDNETCYICSDPNCSSPNGKH